MSDQPKPQDGCKWVKPGWALHPTDFSVNATGARLTAEMLSMSWTLCPQEHLWQRPAERQPDLLHLMKSIKVDASKLSESDCQRHIWNMQQVIREAADRLVYIREEAEKDVILKGGQQ